MALLETNVVVSCNCQLIPLKKMTCTSKWPSGGAAFFGAKAAGSVVTPKEEEEEKYIYARG